jgi:hypothetical protein
MTTYTDVFGGANIYPSEISYASYNLTANVTLNWPVESSATGNFTARIIDVTQDQAGRVIKLPPADEAGDGETILFNNLGSFSFIVQNNAGTQILSAAAGSVFQIYLSNNNTAAGVWQVFQYGASVSAANASLLAGTGLKAIGTALSTAMPVNTFNSNYTAGVSDRAFTFVWTGSGSGTLTLPDPITVGNNWFIVFRNAGGGTVTVTPGGTATIDDLASLAYQPETSSIIVTDGTNFYTIGLGQSAQFAFDYTTIDVAGTGNYTLAGNELNRIAYNFTGVLTGNRSIIVPNTVQQYWVTNSTTGSYTLTVKTSGGTGVTISAGARGIFYCDGSDVVDADTSTISLPVQINQGGTSATTASAARINLGATTVGDALFTAASQAAAYAALGTLSGGTF